jgi:two-component system chemotaxis sensor kinase CheA
MKLKTKIVVGFTIIYGIYIFFQIFLGIKMDDVDKSITNDFNNYEFLNLTTTIQNELNVYSKVSRDLILNPPEELQKKLKGNRDLALQNVNIALDVLQKLDREQTKEIIQKLMIMSNIHAEMDKEMDGLIKEGKIEEVTKLYWGGGREVREEMIEVSNQLYTMQNEIFAEGLNQSSSSYSVVDETTKYYVIFDFILGGIVLLFLLRNVTGRLNKVSSVMGEVNFDSLDKLPRIEVLSKDEISKIAEAFNEMAQTLEKHIKQENELKNIAEEQSWLKTKVADIATMLSGKSDLETLANSFITKITPMVGANYGVFYIKDVKGDEERFRKLATYAYNHEKVGAENFRLGEGGVGQSALENRLILLDRVPENYIKIASGMGNALPSEILIIPAEFQGEVLAVIEIASFESFSNSKQMLLKEVMRNLGTNIKNILRHMQVEKLLEESQALTVELQSQSEELQTQQEELRTVNEQLEEQYENSEQKTKELESIKGILEEKAQQLTLSSQYKSEFLANMSHELRTPLNSLLILAQILGENVERNLTSKQVEYARIIYSSGNDLLNLINDILDISKIEAGKMEVFSEDVMLNEVKEFVEKQFSPVARKKKIQLNVEIASNLPKVIHTDKQRLQQILKNLISNAFKFTDHGTVSLTIQKVEKGMFSQECVFAHSDIELAFSIKDTGIGIPPENQNIIFDAFTQADGTPSRKYGGSGLGLSISRELAHLLGGFIEVVSIDNVGSTFTLYLPDYKDKPRELSEAEVAATYSERLDHSQITSDKFQLETDDVRKQFHDNESLLNKKILVVDDDIRNIYALITALERYQVNVIYAENGREGIEVLQENSDIELILMDIMMPEMDGFEAIKLIRKIPEFEKLPIIALTAKAMKNDREKCIEAGASDYISKPVNLEQLFSIMRVWLYR